MGHLHRYKYDLKLYSEVSMCLPTLLSMIDFPTRLKATIDTVINTSFEFVNILPS